MIQANIIANQTEHKTKTNTFNFSHSILKKNARNVVDVPGLVVRPLKPIQSRGHTYTITDLEKMYGPLSKPSNIDAMPLYEDRANSLERRNSRVNTFDLDLNWFINQGIEPKRAACLAAQKNSLPTAVVFCGLESNTNSNTVDVRGHIKSDGTYVEPYQRTAPDGIPENNFNFPGNYNPNTGTVTPGDPQKYLNRYYDSAEITKSERPQRTPLIKDRNERQRPQITNYNDAIQACSALFKATDPARGQCYDFVTRGTIPK